MSSYSDKLKDPRWQRRRLEIMSRDGFKCVHCCSNTDTLHVHHSYYRKGKEPWDYPDWMLTTLCEECHSSVADLIKIISGAVSRSRASASALWGFGEICDLPDVNDEDGHMRRSAMSLLMSCINEAPSPIIELRRVISSAYPFFDAVDKATIEDQEKLENKNTQRRRKKK